MKKILFSVAVVSIASVVGLNLNLNTQKSAENLLVLANTEALAQNEGGGRQCYMDYPYISCSVFQVTYNCYCNI